MIEVLNPLTMSDWMRLQVTRSRKVGNALKGGGLHFHVDLTIIDDCISDM